MLQADPKLPQIVTKVFIVAFYPILNVLSIGNLPIKRTLTNARFCSQ